MPKEQPNKHKQEKQVRYNINEGLTENSLKYLIKDTISIDEYESKISNGRAIVVGFYVEDEDPADDLSRFINRGSTEILDTEISPNPTKEGYYVTWVEFKRDESFPNLLLNLITDVKNLCKVKRWYFHCPGHKKKIPLTRDNIKKACNLNPENILTVPEKKLHEDTFWKHATVEKVYLEPYKTIFETNGQQYSFINKAYTPDLALNLNSADAIRFQNLIGPAYAVYSAGNGFIVESNGEWRFLLTDR